MTTDDRDFYVWTHEQDNLLRNHQCTDLDLETSSRIESMGRSARRQRVNRLEVLLMHLLQWQHQPAFRGGSWELTIIEQRRRIAKLLRTNPALRPELPTLPPEAYDDASFRVLRETGLPQATFPVACPWGMDEVLGEGWLPG